MAQGRPFFSFGLNHTTVARVQYSRMTADISEQNRTERDGAERNGTEQNRTEQNRTEQNRTEQNRTEQPRCVGTTHLVAPATQLRTFRVITWAESDRIRADSHYTSRFRSVAERRRSVKFSRV